MDYYERMKQQSARPSLTEYLRDKIKALPPARPKRVPIKKQSTSLLSHIRKGMFYAFNSGDLEPVVDDPDLWMRPAAIVSLVASEFPRVAAIQEIPEGEKDYKLVTTALSNFAKATRDEGIRNICPYKEVNPGVKQTARDYFVPHVYRVLWIAEKWLEAREAKKQEDNDEE